MRSRIGLGLANFPFASGKAFWRWVRLCEDGGVDSLWQSDRLVGPEPHMECMSVMAALAGATERLKFGMNVLALGFREPLIVATQCATIDYLSGGRLLRAFFTLEILHLLRNVLHCLIEIVFVDLGKLAVLKGRQRLFGLSRKIREHSHDKRNLPLFDGVARLDIVGDVNARRSYTAKLLLQAFLAHILSFPSVLPFTRRLDLRKRCPHPQDRSAGQHHFDGTGVGCPGEYVVAVDGGLQMHEHLTG